MSESNERLTVPPGTPVPGESEAKQGQPSNHSIDPHNALIETLKKKVQETVLPPDWKEQVLAELPPPEERERLLRELMEKGGLSFEESFESLIAEFEGQP